MLWNRSFTDLPKCLIRTREVCSAASERRGIWTLCEAAREGADGIACINTIADVTYSIWHNLTYIHLSLISPLSLQFWCLLEHLNVIFWLILWPFVQHCRSWNTKYIEQATWVTHGCQTEYICRLYTVYVCSWNSIWTFNTVNKEALLWNVEDVVIKNIFWSLTCTWMQLHIYFTRWKTKAFP